MLTHHLARLAALLAFVVLAGCSPGGEETYSPAEPHEGVELSVQGNGDMVLRAVAFHPGEDPPEVPEEHFGSLQQGEAVIVRNDVRDFDMTVVYRTGPDCDLVPGVELEGSDPPRLVVEPRNEGAGAGRDCPDMEFTEAVGFDFREDVDVEAVDLHVQDR